MIIHIDAARPPRQPGLLAQLHARLAPLFRRTPKPPRPTTIDHMNDHLRRDIGLHR